MEGAGHSNTNWDSMYNMDISNVNNSDETNSAHVIDLCMNGGAYLRVNVPPIGAIPPGELDG